MSTCTNARARAGQRARGALIRTGHYVAVAISGSARWGALGLVAAMVMAGAVRAQDLRVMVDSAASAAGVPSGIAHAVIRQESNYHPAMRRRAGEWGLGQIKCTTAREVGFAGACHLLADAATNLRYAMAYLKRALDRGGAGCAGVSLYQRGVYGRATCSGYGRQVMARTAQ